MEGFKITFAAIEIRKLGSCIIGLKFWKNYTIWMGPLVSGLLPKFEVLRYG
jgi:hypothetical protein